MAHTVVRRLWLPASADACDATSAPGGLFVALQAEGQTIMRTRSHGDIVLREGVAAIVSRREVVALSNTTPTARIEIETCGHGSSRLDVSNALVLHREMSDTLSAAILANAAIGLLNTGGTPLAAAQTPLEAAFLNLVNALVCEIAAHRLGADVAADSDTLIHSALTLIDRHAGDPELTVESVARDLRISARHLARVFRRYLLSPKIAISERRVLSARLLLAAAPTGPLAEVSRASGFSSANALKYHLDRACSADHGAGSRMSGAA